MRREDPERSAPIRDWTAIPRSTEPRGARRQEPGTAPESAEPERGGGWSDVVNQGVELGYRVVEEQIQQGQRVAEDISRQAYGPGAMGDDLREATERMTRYYTELGRLWLEFVTSLIPGAGRIPNPFFPGAPQADVSGPAPPVGPAPPGGTGPAVATEVVSSRPARTRLELRPRAERLELATPGLRSLDPSQPPVTEVVFERRSGGALVLRIHVGEGQPPGTYHGVVVDRRSGEPVGALTLSVS